MRAGAEEDFWRSWGMFTPAVRRYRYALELYTIIDLRIMIAITVKRSGEI